MSHFLSGPVWKGVSATSTWVPDIISRWESSVFRIWKEHPCSWKVLPAVSPQLGFLKHECWPPPPSQPTLFSRNWTEFKVSICTGPVAPSFLRFIREMIMESFCWNEVPLKKSTLEYRWRNLHGRWEGRLPTHGVKRLKPFSTMVSFGAVDGRGRSCLHGLERSGCRWEQSH